MSDIYLKPRMLQICIIAKDCYRLNENWAKLLGKKMAGLSRYEGSQQTLQTEYHGKLVSGLGLETNTFDLASNGKSIQFEILAALNGPSEWYDYMIERNQGFHHVAFEFTEDDFHKGLADLKRNTGMDRVQLGSPYASPEASYAYLATKEPVGTTIEILGFGELGKMAEEYRQITAKMSTMDDKSAPLAMMVPSDVTLIVEDIEKSLGAFVPLFHMEMPEIREEAVTQTESGEKKESCIKTVSMDMTSTNMRFLQPVSGENGWSNYSKAWKTGLYSIAFDVADLAAKSQQLIACNMKLLQSGQYDDGTSYVLLDATADYGVVLELRSSEQIRSRLEKETKESGVTCHSEFRYNERTPLKDIAESPACLAALERFMPGSTKHLQASMAIAYRMPLGMILQMAGQNLTEEALLELLRDMNRDE